jgi:surfeit locus 1 family protein
MSSSPQGYFVVTPLALNENEIVLVNRGWVPRNMVMQDVRRQGAALLQWERPQGPWEVTAVSAKVEQPKFLVAEHDFKTRPPKLYWFDRPAMQAVAGVGPDTSLPLLTVVREAGGASTTPSSWPAEPTADKVGDFKVSPVVHAAYAFTWFSLSAAGMYMTRKLITRGRA